MASGARSASMAERNTVSLAMNPAVGGTPASEIMKSDMAAASAGWRSERPAHELRSSPPPASASLRSISATTPNAPITVAP